MPPRNPPLTAVLRRLDRLPGWQATACGLLIGGLAGFSLTSALPWPAALTGFVILLGAAARLAWSGEPVEEMVFPAEPEPLVNLVEIPSGTLRMGSAEEEVGRRASSSFLADLGKVMLISLVVAVLVFLLLRFLDQRAELVVGIAVAYPLCHGDCVTNLQKWTAELKQTPSSPEALKGAVQECYPYLTLEKVMRRDAKEVDADWELCNLLVIVKEFQRQSAQTGG